MRAIISLILTISGAVGLFLSIRHGAAVGIIFAGLALFGGWWTLERKEGRAMHTDDRQAVHDLLDVALDGIAEMRGDVNFDLATHGWSVRVWDNAKDDWRFYESHTSVDPIDRDVVERIKREFEQMEADTR